MAYQSKSYRNSLGDPLDRPRDPLEDTATDLVRLVKEAADSGGYPDLGKVLQAQGRFATQSQLRLAQLESNLRSIADKVEGRFQLVEQQLRLLLWLVKLLCGAILLTLAGAVMKLVLR